MNETTWEAWEEWKARCALAECGDTTKQVLSDWVVPQVRNLFRAINPTHELAQQATERPTGIDPRWSLMEVHFVAGKKSAGKKYKESLFRCAQLEETTEAKRIAVQKYFSMTCKREVPKLAHKELSEISRALIDGVQLVSLNQPVENSPDGRTFAELYAGADHEGLEPDSAAAKAELDRIARQEAEAWFAKMTLLEKLVWGCVAARRTLDDPALERLASVKSTQLYKLRKDASVMFQFRDALRAKYAGKHERTVDELAIQAGSELAKLCQQVLPPENLAEEGLSQEGK